jgi:hypothetical protein
MKYFALVILLFFHTLSYAVGPTTIRGLNQNGETFTIDEENFDYENGVSWGPNMFYTILVERDSKIINRYKKQLCGFHKNGNFSCREDGDSPLAGAKYQFIKYLKKCGGSLFLCQNGCGSLAPKELRADTWECYESSPCDKSNYKEKEGMINAENVNIRIKPDLNASLVTRMNKYTKVTILDRKIGCQTINYEKGEWIKIEQDLGAAKIIGWVFDAYIEYPPNYP